MASPTGRPDFRRSWRFSSGSVLTISIRSKRRWAATRSTATTSGPGSSTSRPTTAGIDDFREDYEQLSALGQDVVLLDRDAMQAEINSPTYRGGLWRKGRAALVDPARLAWGLKAAAEAAGVRIYEDTKAVSIERDGVGVLVKTPLGQVRAARVALATNAFKPLLKTDGPLHRAGLRLRHGHRTADRLADGRASAGRIGKGYPTTPISFTTTDSPPTIGSCGAGTTPSTTSGARSIRSSIKDPRRSPRSPSISSRRFPNSKGLNFSHLLGRGHRYLHPLHGLLGQGPLGAGCLRGRLHGTRGGGRPLRGRGHARPSRRAQDPGHSARFCSTQTDTFSSRTVSISRDSGDPVLARSRGSDRQTQSLAASARSPRPRLRQLMIPLEPDCAS